jgi:hypothetical protein
LNSRALLEGSQQRSQEHWLVSPYLGDTCGRRVDRKRIRCLVSGYGSDPHSALKGMSLVDLEIALNETQEVIAAWHKNQPDFQERLY